MNIIQTDNKNQLFQTPRNNRTVKQLLIMVGILVVTLIAASVFIFKDTRFLPKIENKPDFLVDIKTDKTLYNQGENINFTISNKGEKAIWYFIPPLRCNKNIFWTVMKKTSDIAWDSQPVWPECEIEKSEYAFIEINKLEPQKDVGSKWDQKISIPNEEISSYASQGKYKIIFIYSEKELSIEELKENSNSSPETKQVYSNEFEISDNPSKNPTEVKEENSNKNSLKKVFTVNKYSIENFQEETSSWTSKNVVIVTGKTPDELDNEIIREINSKNKFSIKKETEINDDTKKLNNLIIVGKIDTNGLIEEIYKTTLVADIGDFVEENAIKATLKYAKNPWNKDKKIFILETDYAMGESVEIKGEVEVEINREEGFLIRAIIKDESGNIYALVSTIMFPVDLGDFDKKRVNLVGYKRILHSNKIITENSISVSTIKAIK